VNAGELVQAWKLRNRKRALLVVGATLIVVSAVWLGLGYWEQLERDRAAAVRHSHGVYITVCYFDAPFGIGKRIFCGLGHLAGWACVIRAVMLGMPDPAWKSP
jgi:hypothetical protein